MKILGISAYYHDAAACLVVDGEIIAAVQEERFTRKKHDLNFPVNAIAYCLIYAKITSKDIDYVVFYDKPFLKFERLLETYLAFAPRGFKSFATSLPIWLKDKLFQKSVIVSALNDLWGKNGNWLDVVNQKNSSADMAPTAGQMPRAVGLAFASKCFREAQQKNKALHTNLSNNGNEICFCTIGDASTSEGHFWESINAAAVLQIPLANSETNCGFKE